MKTYLFSLLILLVSILGLSCEKHDFAKGTLSPIININDVKDLYKGSEVALSSSENLGGASQIVGVVISDAAQANIPGNLLVIQGQRRGLTSGIVLNITSGTSKYILGDSVVVDIEGARLTKENNVLQIQGVTDANISVKSSGDTLAPVSVKSSDLIANPSKYEGVLVTLSKATFDPSYPENTIYDGDKIINDGFGNITLHTESAASYAQDEIPYMANLTGIVLSGADGNVELWPRGQMDITVLNSTPSKISPIIITGFLADPTSTDANYEYIQLLATEDIDFSLTPFALVTCNNAGTSEPTGAPVNGWATGNQRSYKFNLTDGSVKKGTYFYVGGNKNIWGAGSTDISSAQWIVSKKYADIDGEGFGAKTTNLLANSGNAAGIAVFDKTDVDETSVPVDVVFYGGNGQLFSPSPLKGYLITNTDYYDLVHPVDLNEQPYFTQGSNTNRFAFPTAANFAQLGGTYNITSARWTTGRTVKNVALTATSAIAEIEGATTIEE